MHRGVLAKGRRVSEGTSGTLQPSPTQISLRFSRPRVPGMDISATPETGLLQVGPQLPPSLLCTIRSPQHPAPSLGCFAEPAWGAAAPASAPSRGETQFCPWLVGGTSALLGWLWGELGPPSTSLRLFPCRQQRGRALQCSRKICVLWDCWKNEPRGKWGQVWPWLKTRAVLGSGTCAASPPWLLAAPRE